MKKVISFILAVILIVCLCCSCGSSGKYASESVSDSYYNDYKKGSSIPQEPSYAADYYEEPAPEMESYEGYDSDGAIIADANSANIDLSQKLIQRAWISVQTIRFEESINAVYSLLNKYNAFLESSYIDGKSYSETYYNKQSYRTAEFTIRVPKENYRALTSDINTVGNILDTNSTIENITSRYTDVESRLKTYRTEEDRLREMLSKAETVEDMITIETRLSEVTYNIERLTSTLREWDNDVDYCTVYLTIKEVKEIVEQIEPTLSYWEEMRTGFVSSIKSVGRGFKNFFLGFVIALPDIIVTLVILAIIAIIVIAIIKACKKHSAKRKDKLESAAPKKANKKCRRNKKNRKNKTETIEENKAESEQITDTDTEQPAEERAEE